MQCATAAAVAEAYRGRKAACAGRWLFRPDVARKGHGGIGDTKSDLDWPTVDDSLEELQRVIAVSIK